MLTPKVLLDGDRRLADFPDLTAADGAPVIVGWREWAGLPLLGIARLRAKIDTGARTSALHANSIETIETGNGTMVRFDMVGEGETAPWHEAPLTDRRLVRSSNGEAEMRSVVRTDLFLAGRTWPIEITLSNRERMEAPMLIGREALAGHVLVDAARSWMWGRPTSHSRRRKGAQQERGGGRT